MSASVCQHSALPTKWMAPDAALPQRDVFLRPEAMAIRLTSYLGKEPTAIQGCFRRRAKYQPGRSLRVLYEISLSGESHLISVRAYDPRNPRSGFKDRGPLGTVIYEPTLNATFCVFPHDRKIKHLAALSEASLVSKDEEQYLHWQRSRIVAYAPEKSATAQFLDRRDKVIAYAKVYADRVDLFRVYHIYRALTTAIKERLSNLQIAELFALVESQHLLLLKSVHGKNISNLSGRERMEALGHLGNALGDLHSLEVAGMLPRFKRIAADRLIRAAEIIGCARPDVAKLASDLARRLCCEFLSSERLVCLHGDVHPKNAIAQKDHVTLIDFDQAAIGARAADLGSMLAAIRYGRITGSITDDVADEMAQGFLSGYHNAQSLPRKKSLQWHTAAACLAERALRAVTCVRPEGLRHLRELLLDGKSRLRSTTDL